MKKTNYKSHIMTYRNMERNNYNDLYFLIEELQRDIKHNYTLIKSLHTRIKCLEDEIHYRDKLDVLDLKNVVLDAM